jgi:hypothetical protein
MRVRANSEYIYEAAGLHDLCSPASSATKGQRVRVVALRGCPPPNTMGHAHIEDAATHEFLGLVQTSSLTPAPKARTR